VSIFAVHDRELQALPCLEQGHSVSSIPMGVLHSLSEDLPAEIRPANLSCSGSSTQLQAAGPNGVRNMECSARHSAGLRIGEEGGLEGWRSSLHPGDTSSSLCTQLSKCDSAYGQSKSTYKAVGVEKQAEHEHKQQQWKDGQKMASLMCLGVGEGEQPEEEPTACW